MRTTLAAAKDSLEMFHVERCPRALGYECRRAKTSCVSRRSSLAGANSSLQSLKLRLRPSRPTRKWSFREDSELSPTKREAHRTSQRHEPSHSRTLLHLTRDLPLDLETHGRGPDSVFALTSDRNVAFLVFDSISVTSRPGTNRASGMPGRPAPEPTSASRPFSIGTAGMAAILSPMWNRRMSSGSITVVRETRRFH